MFSANVDPYFSATLIAAITGEDEIEVEEAFFRTLALPAGFTAKGGRFFSGFGYLNEVHAHAWDFIDQPLVYQAFFGDQLAQDGVQVKWLAPTDLFIELGAETGNGEAFPGTRRDRNGLNGATLFAHLGGDLGESTELARRRARGSTWTPRPHLRGRRRAWRAGRQCLYRQFAHLGRRRRAQVAAVRRCLAPRAQAAGRVLPPQREQASSPSTPKGWA